MSISASFGASAGFQLGSAAKHAEPAAKPTTKSLRIKSRSPLNNSTSQLLDVLFTSLWQHRFAVARQSRPCPDGSRHAVSAPFRARGSTCEPVDSPLPECALVAEPVGAGASARGTAPP